jgi:hypothetical protein
MAGAVGALGAGGGASAAGGASGAGAAGGGGGLMNMIGGIGGLGSMFGGGGKGGDKSSGGNEGYSPFTTAMNDTIGNTDIMHNITNLNQIAQKFDSQTNPFSKALGATGGSGGSMPSLSSAMSDHLSKTPSDMDAEDSLERIKTAIGNINPDISSNNATMQGKYPTNYGLGLLKNKPSSNYGLNLLGD